MTNHAEIQEAALNNATFLDMGSRKNYTALNQTDLEAIAKIRTLETLLFSTGADFETYEPLSALPDLRKLAINHFCNEDLSSLASITQLQELSLSECEHYASIEFLTKLTDLTVLDLTDGLFRDLSPIAELIQLRVLLLTNCDAFPDLCPLAKLTYLTDLDLRGISPTDLEPLRNLTSLRSLKISGNIDSIDPIRHLTQLELFELSYCNTITEFTFLKAFKNLKELTLCSAGLRDLSSLAGLRSLERDAAMALCHGDGARGRPHRV